MSKIVTMPYLFFNGNCREAMEFYKSVFGGKLEIMTNENAKMTAEDRPAEQIMHSALSGGEVELMASDSAMASPVAKKISLSLNDYGGNESKMKKIFADLSQGVEVQYPLEKSFWGSMFGAFQDKYGIEWMFDITLEKK